MSYNCNYILKSVDKTYHQYSGPCFGNFYNSISEYKEIEYYVPVTGTGGFVTPFGEELILKYNELLVKLGLKFEYLGYVTTNFKQFNDKFEEFEAFAYKIVFEQNSIMGNKLVLNFLRYLYEQKYPTIVNNIFKFLELNLDECLFNIFVLAHYNECQPGGHDIRGTNFFDLFKSEDEYFQWLNTKRGDSYSVYSIIPQLRGKYIKLHQTFNEDLSEFYKQYKQVIEDESKQCQAA